MIPTWIYIFIFIAVPEELYFRAWVQNLLERRRRTAGGARDYGGVVRALTFQQTSQL